jgi:CO/xanthine dehydrogenase Mo-binding subunit
VTASIGRSVPRADAESKVKGEAIYGVDFEIAGTLYAALVRSPVAAGRILAIDTTGANKMPGVKAVVTARQAPPILSGLALDDQPLFAADVVRYEGEPIAAVIAETLPIARAAVREIRVDIAEVEAVATIEQAVSDGARLVHEDWQRYTRAPGVPEWPRGGNVCGEMRVDPEGVDEAFAEADLIVEDEFRSDRQYQAYMEPKSATGRFEDGRYTIHVSHQFPFNVRERTARALGVRPSDVRVIGHHIGGGFGARLDVGLEPYAALLARLAGAPVKLVNDRMEDLLTCNSRENAIIRIRSGVSRDGRIVARTFLCDVDAGAYATDTVLMTSLAIFVTGSVYRVGLTRVVSRAIYTNTAPTGAMRGVAGPYLYFSLERHMDNLANAIGMDRREFRLRNLITDGHQMLNGQVLEDGGIVETAFDELEKLAPWAGLGKGPNRGVGIGAAVWLTNPLPGQATLKLEADGTLTVSTAATENGSGAVAMGVRQIAAEELTVAPDDVVLVLPDTAVQGYDGGSQGSRTTHSAGRAVQEAAVEVRERALQMGARMLGEMPDAVEIAEGCVRVRARPQSKVTLAEVASAAMFDKGPIVGTGSYATPLPKFNPDAATGLLFPTFPTPTYHVHIAEVEVDPSTGRVHLLRYFVAQEVGKAINPAAIHGQIQGGVTQGVGYALYEGLQVGEDGRYVQRTLESYRLPIASDVPRVQAILLEHPDGAGPYGARGVAEPPIVPVAAAIGNAVADATGGAITQVPMTPEHVLNALSET